MLTLLSFQDPRCQCDGKFLVVRLELALPPGMIDVNAVLLVAILTYSSILIVARPTVVSPN